MGRPNRVDVAGYAYHVINRAAGRRMIFRTDRDFEALEAVLAEAVERAGGGVGLLAYCVMGNHWHLVLRTAEDGALSPFMKWLTLTHTQRHQAAHKRVGYGPVYQGRFKSFIVESGEHLLTVCRYVERNAARASLVQRAEDWRWSSLWRWREQKHAAGDRASDAGGLAGEPGGPGLPGAAPHLVLSPWPTGGVCTPAADGSGRPRNWLRRVNTPQSEAELAALRRSVEKGRPFGGERWSARLIERHGLASTTRDRGRPGREHGKS